MIDEEKKEEEQFFLGIERIIDIDLKEIDEYEELGLRLKLEMANSKKLAELEEVEVKFNNLKIKIENLLNNLKEKVLSEVSFAELLKFKSKKNKEYLMARITHQSFNIPVILERIIMLEDVNEGLFAFLEEKKIEHQFPAKKWELIESKKYSIKKECMKVEDILNNQKSFIENTKKNLSASNFDTSLKNHVFALNSLSLKINTLAHSLTETEINEKNLLGLIITTANLDNIVRGFNSLVSLEDFPYYINRVSLEDQVIKHLDDYRLLAALINDLLVLIKKGLKDFNKTFAFDQGENKLIEMTLDKLHLTYEIIKKKEDEIKNF